MPKRFTVAIVGRPNVGKSALFNRMVSAGASIVHKESGVTRDRLYGTCSWLGREFTLLDTGGLDLGSSDDMVQAIRSQVEQALTEADALILVVDARAGLTSEDLNVADLLRRRSIPLVVAANKCDAAHVDQKAMEFYELGFEDVFPVSALHGMGVGDLLDRILEIMANDAGAGPAEAEAESAGVEEAGFGGLRVPSDEAAPPIRIAIVGKPNVGKSSLANAILGDERMTVSQRPGTTVDAVDTLFTFGGTDLVLIDTAGLRRPTAIGDKLEELAVGRALGAVKRCDVAILMVDGQEAPTAQDRRIAGYIARNAKGSVIVVNKVDLGLHADTTREQFRAAVLHQCRPIGYSNVVFTSCATGQGIDEVIPAVLAVYEEYAKRIETAVLNDFLMEATEVSRPPQRAKFYYGTQVEVKPPRMVFFVKDPSAVSDMYRRYLEGQIRRRFGFTGVPIVMEFRPRRRKKQEG